MALYEYLVQNYGVSKPIFLSDIKIEGMTNVNLRQQMKKLHDLGKIRRLDSGIYFVPVKVNSHIEFQPSIEKVIEQKYLIDKNKCCGYISGLLFANQLEGLEVQTPTVYEIVTNKATKHFRETSLADIKIIIRKPRNTVTEENYKILQFLDLIKDIDIFCEAIDNNAKDCIIKYMKKVMLEFTMLEPYLSDYPDKIYKNMYQLGLLQGTSIL